MVLFNFNGKALSQLLQSEAQLLRAQLEPQSASQVKPEVWVPKASLTEMTKREKKKPNTSLKTQPKAWQQFFWLQAGQSSQSI